MAEVRLLKCRFCEFRTPTHRRLKDGRVRSGWNILQSHIEVEHPEDHERIMKWWEDYRNEPNEDSYGDNYGDWLD
jgi:hypothetical protein